MPDVVSWETRSRMMSGIRAKDTQPEMLIRKALHARGFRYRLHVASMPGRPDMVFPRYRAVILAHGCFWHGHDCALFRLPESRREFWEAKIRRNRERDQEVDRELAADGWRRLAVWECAMRGRGRLAHKELVARIEEWLKGSGALLEIRGTG